jgi:hypothetical protein
MVKTERMIMGASLMGGLEKVESEGESPEFVGDVVAAFAADPHRLERTAKIWSTRKLAQVEFNNSTSNSSFITTQNLFLVLLSARWWEIVGC